MKAFDETGCFTCRRPPSQFAEVTEMLAQAELLRKHDGDEGWQRIVVEKPFGHDLASARQLNLELTRFAHEKQIYRMTITWAKKRCRTF
jgi:glucose-6-phosphate 1-dehydrogenase